MRWIDGRAETAPTLDSVESAVSGWYEDDKHECQENDFQEEQRDEMQETADIDIDGTEIDIHEGARHGIIIKDSGKHTARDCGRIR